MNNNLITFNGIQLLIFESIIKLNILFLKLGLFKNN